MRDAMGGTVALVIIVIFIVIFFTVYVHIASIMNACLGYFVDPVN